MIVTTTTAKPPIETNKLKKIFNSEAKLFKNYGKENGRLIMRRLGFLAAAPSLAKVPHTKPFRRHQLSGKQKDLFTVDLKHPRRLVFKPNHDPLPRKKDGGLDLTKITAITILGVKDTH